MGRGGVNLRMVHQHTHKKTPSTVWCSSLDLTVCAKSILLIYFYMISTTGMTITMTTIIKIPTTKSTIDTSLGTTASLI